MRNPILVPVAAALAFVLCPAAPQSVAAQTALTGQVASAQEGAMEGVVVSARKTGATVTVSVVSDGQGRYSFPAAKLEPGAYSLRIRAVGYELDGPETADVTPGQTATADIKLRPTRNLRHNSPMPNGL